MVAGKEKDAATYVMIQPCSRAYPVRGASVDSMNLLWCCSDISAIMVTMLFPKDTFSSSFEMNGGWWICPSDFQIHRTDPKGVWRVRSDFAETSRNLPWDKHLSLKIYYSPISFFIQVLILWGVPLNVTEKNWITRNYKGNPTAVWLLVARVTRPWNKHLRMIFLMVFPGQGLQHCNALPFPRLRELSRSFSLIFFFSF